MNREPLTNPTPNIRKPAIRFETFDLFWASPPPILAELFTQINPSMPASGFPTFPHIFACGSACISGEANCRFTDAPSYSALDSSFYPPLLV